VPATPFYKEHWVNIEPEQLERYQRMFQWNPASHALYEPADIRPGHIVAELGCGPGHTAIEIAKWVGPGGHVHALDINAEFIAQARRNADAAGVGDRVTAYRCDGSMLPLPQASLDRLTARNTLIYVDDPQATLRECRRVLRPSGKIHAIEGDWPMMVVEPVPAAEWSALVTAASVACRTPDIGRKLYALLRHAGFSGIEVQLVTRPDTEGRLLPMIKRIADYARASGKIGDAEIDKILFSIEQAHADGSYLFLAPQFVVTASASDAAHCTA
jgi:ubiquinone/menaquinone biosynthesis C-methylase UbiE